MWNCRSIYNKLFELKRYVYIRKPDVICLQETWIRENYVPSFINYRGVLKNRNGRGGGIAIFVRNQLVMEEIDLQQVVNGQLEVQAVRITTTAAASIDILNLYNPNRVVTEQEFSFYLNQLGNKAVVLGDLNAHHNLWDGRVNRPCQTGSHLIDAIAGKQLQLVTPQSLPTFLDSRNGLSSTLDLCFVSACLFHATKLEPGEDCGSDHCPIHITIDILPQECKRKMRRKWKFTDEWTQYRQRVSANTNVEDDWTIEETTAYVTGKLFEAAEVIFGRTKAEVNFKYNKIWWTPDCELVTRSRKRATGRLRRQPTMLNARIKRQTAATAQQVLDETKASKFKERVSKIHSQTSIGEAWNGVQKLKSTYRPQNSPLLVGNNLITNNVEKAQEFARYYGSVFDVEDVCTLAEVEQHQAAVHIALRDIGGDYNTVFTMEEMTATISNLKGTSPGLDEIHNKMITNLPMDILAILLDLFNRVWLEGSIPKCWKVALILKGSPVHIVQYLCCPVWGRSLSEWYVGDCIG